MAGTTDVKLELEVEALLTPGKTHTDKLERAVAAALSSIKTPKLEISPELELKFDGNKGQVKRALRKASTVIEAAIQGEWDEVTKRSSLAVSRSLRGMEGSVLLSVKEAYDKIGAALAQPMPSKFKDAGFLRQVQLVMGDPAEYDRLNKTQKRKVQEYIQFSKQQVGQMQQVVNSLNSLNRLRQGKNGDAMFASPISMPKVQQDLKILKEFNAALEKTTSNAAVTARAKASQNETEKANKEEEKRYQDHLEKMADAQARADAEEKAARQRKIDNAYADLQVFRKNQAALQVENEKKTKAAIASATTSRGDALINEKGLNNLKDVPKGEQAYVQDALRARIAAVREEMAQQLLQGRQNDKGYQDNVRHLADLNKAMKDSQSAMARTGAAAVALGRNVESSGGLLRQFFRYALGYGALYQALSAITALGKGLVDLDKQLYSIQAVSGATNDEMISIESAIKTVAQETKFSVNEIAEAAKTLAQAGTDPKNFAGTLQATAAFAAATESSIATAADLMTTLKTVYASLDDMTASNQLTKAVNISKLSADDLKSILSLSAQVAKSYNLTSDQYLAAVTTLRNAGLKASTVATGLREGMLEIFNPDKKTIKALKKRYMEIGEEMTSGDVQARFFQFTQDANPLVAVLRELDRLGFNGGGRQTLGRAFDVRATNALSALIANLKELESSSANISFGNASLIGSATQMQSLANATENLGGAIVNMADSLVGDALPVLQRFVVFLTGAVDKITALNDEMRATTGDGLGSALGVGVGGAVIGALAAGKGITRRVGGALLGGAAATAASGAAEAGGTGQAIATGAGVLSTILLVFDIIKRIKGIRTATTVVAEGAEVVTGVVGALSGLAKLKNVAMLGLRVTGWGAVAAIAIDVLMEITDAFGTAGKGMETLKVMAAQSAANTQKAMQSYEGKMDAIDSLRPSSPERPASAGKARAEVENVAKLAKLADAEIARFFNVSGDSLEKVKSILSTLSDNGNTESGSGSRDALIQKLSEVTGQTVESLKKSDFAFSSYADSLRQVGATTEVIRSSLYNEFTRGRELEEAGQEIDVSTKALVSTLRTWLTSGDQSLRNKYLKLAGILGSTPQEMVAIINEATTTAYDSGMEEVNKEKAKVVKGIEEQMNALRLAIINGLDEEQVKVMITGIIEAKQRLGESQEKVAEDVKKFLDDINANLVQQVAEGRRKAMLGPREGGSTAPLKAATTATNNANSLIPYVDLTARALFDRQTKESQAVVSKAETTALDKAKQILELLKDPKFNYLTNTVQGQDAIKTVQEKIANGGRLTVGDGRGPKGLPAPALDSPELKTLYDMGATAKSRAQQDEEVRRKLADVMVEDLATQQALVDIDKQIAEATRTGANASGLLAQKKNLQVKLIDDQIAFQQGRLGRADDPVEKRNIENQIQQLQLQKYTAEAEYVQQSAQSNRDYLNRMDELRSKEIDNKAKLLADKTDIAIAQGNEDAAQALIDERKALLLEQVEVERAKLERAGKTKAEVDAELAERIRLANNLRLSAADRQAIRDRELKMLERMPEDGGSADPFQAAKDKAQGKAYSLEEQQKQINDKFQAYLKMRAKWAERLAEINPNNSTEAAQEAIKLADAIRDIDGAMGRLQASTERFSGTFGSAMDKGFDVDQISKKLENQAGTWDDMGTAIQDKVVQGVNDVAGGMAEVVVQGGNVIDVTGRLVASTLQGIAQMIIQKQILLGINWALGAMGFTGFATGGSDLQVDTTAPMDTGGVTAATGAASVQVEKRAAGGVVGNGDRRASGLITGPGTGTSDSIAARIIDRKRNKTAPLLVSAGESILTEKVTRSLGEGTIDRWNRDGVVTMATGGVVKTDASDTIATPTRGGNVFQIQGTHVELKSEGGTTDEEDRKTAIEVRKMIDERVNTTLLEMIRPGGLLNKDGRNK